MNEHEEVLVSLCRRLRRERSTQARVVMHARGTAADPFGIDVYAVWLVDEHRRWMAATETNPRQIGWGGDVVEAVERAVGPSHSAPATDPHGLTLVVPCGPSPAHRFYLTPVGTAWFAYDHGRSHAGTFQDSPALAVTRLLEDDRLLRAD